MKNLCIKLVKKGYHEQENLSHRMSVLEVRTRVHKIPNSALFGFAYQQRLQT